MRKMARAIFRTSHPILPGTGRGTARRAVEGPGPTHKPPISISHAGQVCQPGLPIGGDRVARGPSTMLRMVPLPVPGRIGLPP